MRRPSRSTARNVAERSTWTHRLEPSIRPPPEGVERIALFTWTFAGESAQELLAGFAERSAAQARAVAEQLSGLDGGAKRARAAREFGERWDAADRVRALLAEAAGLEDELASRVPTYLLPRAAPARSPRKPGPPRAPARVALVDRLVREAVR